MTPRTLFNIILKILGIFFIKDIIVSLLQLISFIVLMTSDNRGGEGVWFQLSTFFFLAFYTLIAYYLIFRSNLIIDKLKLDQGFDQETIPLNIHRSTILSISIIVIGGLLIVEEIPNLCQQLFSYFQQKRIPFSQLNPSISFSVLAAVKVLIGLLLIGNQKLIVNFIERKRKN